jgi:hypothetical protein
LFTISQSHRPTKLFTISNLMSAPTTLETLHHCSADLPHLILNLYCALKFDSCDLVSFEFSTHHSLTYFPPTSFLFLCDLHQHLLHSSIQLLSFVGYHAISFLAPINSLYLALSIAPLKDIKWNFHYLSNYLTQTIKPSLAESYRSH